VLTAVNIAGVKAGAGTQNWLTTAEVLGLLAIMLQGCLLAPGAVAAPASAEPGQTAFACAWIRAADLRAGTKPPISRQN